MKRLLSCEFNMDTACVELKFANGSMIAIDTIAVENEVADNIYQRSELDWLIYNDPAAYADLVLNGDPGTYLKTVGLITRDKASRLCGHIKCSYRRLFLFVL